MIDEVVIELVPSGLKGVELRSNVLLLGSSHSDVEDQVLVLGHLEGNEFSQAKQLRLKRETLLLFESLVVLLDCRFDLYPMDVLEMRVS